MGSKFKVSNVDTSILDGIGASNYNVEEISSGRISLVVVKSSSDKSEELEEVGKAIANGDFYKKDVYVPQKYTPAW